MALAVAMMAQPAEIPTDCVPVQVIRVNGAVPSTHKMQYRHGGCARRYEVVRNHPKTLQTNSIQLNEAI